MCGRFTLKTPPDQWGQLLLPMVDFAKVSSAWQPRYNIAPTQQIVAIARDAQQQLQADYYRWGLVPSWAAELAIGNQMINARSESLLEKRSFKGPLEKNRCLIVADGYYEWQKCKDGSKQPHWIAPVDGGLLQFAGLWETNRRATGTEVRSCTIITTAANAALAHLHDRMPVILHDDVAQQWMDAECDAVEAQQLLGPAEEDLLASRAVSKHVNNPRHEDAGCLDPI